MFTYLVDFMPEPSFLSDIAAFESVILAFLVPLSIDIISKISERYKSDVITYLFQKPWQIRYLPLILLINIVLTIGLRFLMEDGAHSSTWKIISFIIFFLFVFVIYLVCYSIGHIKYFMTNESNIIKFLNKNAERALEK